jgi:tRNA dimethylallyltransferase
MPRSPSHILVLTGPTASGKTSLSLDAADATHGCIINADSQQVYQDLRILTARPTKEEASRAPHHLFGHIDGSIRYSAGQWQAEATRTIKESWQQGRTPILVGGTGLYIRTLYEGLATIPDITDATRNAARDQLDALGTQGFYETLQTIDPLSSQIRDPNNPQRLLRAWEVMHQTGRSLFDWQQEPTPAPFSRKQFTCFALLPDREANYKSANDRVPQMVEEGVLEEVKTLLARKLDSSLPIMKSHGLREFGRYLDGTWSMDEAIDATRKVTRHYIKRQHTWLKHQCPDYISLGDNPLQQILHAIAS